MRGDRRRALLRDILQDIVPLKDILSGEDDIERLFEDATFRAELEKRAGRRVSKKELREVLDEDERGFRKDVKHRER
ncbi:MAG: hypothetical protein H5T47_00620 [Archaeoglobi archaeon]|nr:hypothetical protein [Candidatus Mnemosynella bozhongmuii]